MLFAVCVPDGLFVLFGLVALIFVVALVAGGVATAYYLTVGLAKWAAARHNRLAANAR